MPGVVGVVQGDIDPLPFDHYTGVRRARPTDDDPVGRARHGRHGHRHKCSDVRPKHEPSRKATMMIFRGGDMPRSIRGNKDVKNIHLGAVRRVWASRSRREKYTREKCIDKGTEQSRKKRRSRLLRDVRGAQFASRLLSVSDDE